MEIFIYLIIFIMGTFFGSFFTLAVYRIPLKQDILYTHSYCPNCKHKLNTLDLFPILSYIILKGRCRYCGEKIRIRYFLLEILGGIVFLLYAISFKFNIMYFEIYKIIKFAFVILYFVSLFLIAGIDKENVKIEKCLLIYGFILSIAYIIYVCTNYKVNVYSYIIYIILMLIFMIINEILLHKYQKNNYYILLISLFSYMLIFSNLIGFIITFTISIIAIFINLIINKILKTTNNKIPIAFYISIINIIYMILVNYLQYYILKI